LALPIRAMVVCVILKTNPLPASPLLFSRHTSPCRLSVKCLSLPLAGIPSGSVPWQVYTFSSSRGFEIECEFFLFFCPPPHMTFMGVPNFSRASPLPPPCPFFSPQSLFFFWRLCDHPEFLFTQHPQTWGPFWLLFSTYS